MWASPPIPHPGHDAVPAHAARGEKYTGDMNDNRTAADDGVRPNDASEPTHPDAAAPCATPTDFVTSEGMFDVPRFHAALDALFAAHRTDAVEQFLLDALAETDDLGDARGRLSVLAELIGFYRSRGRHAENLPLVQQSIELALSLGLEGTPEFTTTLINAATELRAAKQYDQSEDLYRRAIESAASTLPATSHDLAALHNNLALLYQEINRNDKAIPEFDAALEILERCGDSAVDVASTHSNLALTLLALGRSDEALDHARAAVQAYADPSIDSAHEAAAEATLATVLFRRGELSGSQAHYDKALAIIRERYGEDSEYYRVTKDNSDAVRDAIAATAHGAHDGTAPHVADADPHVASSSADAADDDSSATPAEPAAGSSADATVRTAHVVDPMTGLRLARAYWEECGKPLIERSYAGVRSRIAAGLVGHGSECYGFDDTISRDHDFGPGFCIWLTDDDYAEFGERLQRDYDALPQTFHGFGSRLESDHAGKRVGVFRIGDFFESVTGLRQAPDDDALWVTLDEPTLSAATNGQVFADPVGAFSHARQAFKSMPEREILRRVSQRLGMASQAGQYNLPRMVQRGDMPAARLCTAEFCTAVTSLVFLVNNPLTVGYMPYYKWQFAALRRLSSRPGMRLTGVCAELEALTACDPASPHAATLVDSVCREITYALLDLGWTRSTETFLEWQRPYVEELMTTNP